MKFFIKNNQRIGTSYYEFYKGKWDKETSWNENSIYLHSDILYDARDFEDAIMEVVPGYNPEGSTEINVDEWIEIGRVVDQKDIFAREIYQDANMWVQLACVECGCITIINYVE